jgi:hypothetical protein
VRLLSDEGAIDVWGLEIGPNGSSSAYSAAFPGGCSGAETYQERTWRGSFVIFGAGRSLTVKPRSSSSVLLERRAKHLLSPAAINHCTSDVTAQSEPV